MRFESGSTLNSGSIAARVLAELEDKEEGCTRCVMAASLNVHAASMSTPLKMLRRKGLIVHVTVGITNIYYAREHAPSDARHGVNEPRPPVLKLSKPVNSIFNLAEAL